MEKEKIKIRDIPPFGLRMPDEMRSQLEHEARTNGRSLNMEIVGRLRKSLTDASAGAAQFAVRESANGSYMPEITDLERQLLTIFRRLSVEKQLALLSLFN